MYYLKRAKLANHDDIATKFPRSVLTELQGVKVSLKGDKKGAS